MGVRLDEIDRRIIYHMMADARNTPAPDIASELNVSAGTIRNRLSKLEEAGIISGFHAQVDFDKIEDTLTAHCTGSVPVKDRERISREALGIPGVIEVRTLFTGPRNLHVTVVADDKQDLFRVSRALEDLGVDIADETLVQEHLTTPYEPFGPSDERRSQTIADFVNLSGDAELAEFTVTDDAPVAELTIESASDAGLIDESVLVVAIERGGEVITPKGDTTFTAGDIVTIFARRGSVEAVLDDIIRTDKPADVSGEVNR